LLTAETGVAAAILEPTKTVAPLGNAKPIVDSPILDIKKTAEAVSV
jgi:hypothetical protein